ESPGREAADELRRCSTVWPLRLASPWCLGVLVVKTNLPIEGLEGDVLVGIDADAGGDRHRPPDGRLGVHRGVVDEGARRGERVGAARADADDAVLRLEHVAGAREN